LTIDKNNKKCQILKHYFAGILDWVPVEFNNPQDSGAVFWGPLWIHWKKLWGFCLCTQNL